MRSLTNAICFTLLPRDHFVAKCTSRSDAWAPPGCCRRGGAGGSLPPQGERRVRPSAVPAVPARVIRGVFMSRALRGPELPPEAALEKAGWVAEHVCAEVAQRQFVFTRPERWRLYFRYDRSLSWESALQDGGQSAGAISRAASDDLLAGPKRKFQIFDPLDFLPEVTPHIPEMREHLIPNYGWYSNKQRGQRAQAHPPTPEGSAPPPSAPSAREARKRW